MRGCTQVDGVRSREDGHEDDEWILEAKYIGRLDDEGFDGAAGSGTADDYDLFGPDDEDDQE